MARQKCKVFVSYSRHDEEFVKPLAGLLGAAAGDAVFLDVSSIKPGERWKDEIDVALQDASVFVLCWCCQSKASDFMSYEVGKALESGHKRLVPVLFCGIPLPAQLADYQWVDLRKQIVHQCNHAAQPSQALPVKGNIPSRMRSPGLMFLVASAVLLICGAFLIRHTIREHGMAFAPGVAQNLSPPQPVTAASPSAPAENPSVAANKSVELQTPHSKTPLAQPSPSPPGGGGGGGEEGNPSVAAAGKSAEAQARHLTTPLPKRQPIESARVTGAPARAPDEKRTAILEAIVAAVLLAGAVALWLVHARKRRRVREAEHIARVATSYFERLAK